MVSDKDNSSSPQAQDRLGKFRSFLGKRKLDKEQTSPSQQPVLEIDQVTRGMDDHISHQEGTPKWTNEDLKAPSLSSHVETALEHNNADSDAVRCMDGATDHNSRRGPVVAAIFIHAGAGYHSAANEHLHLKACSEAARAAMKLLKKGVAAIDGVEAAIRVLEDSEITNSGYGSNLAIDGTVECDATLIDHLGRSGACGAVPNIKNPISLAKMILEKSSQPLTLRRIPPNLLVGEGAKDFAWENGMSVVPNEWLVSRNARDRYMKWKADLKGAEATPSISPAATPADDQRLTVPEHMDQTPQKAQRDHANAILTGTWNEGQPDSPAQPATPSENGSPLSTSGPVTSRSLLPNDSTIPQSPTKGPNERSAMSILGALSPSKASSVAPAPKRPRFRAWDSAYSVNNDGSNQFEVDMGGRESSRNLTDSLSTASALVPPETPNLYSRLIDSTECVKYGEEEDKITDTVGAIAIDQWGNMAAGSSSGGIGMKHRGRVGPAALIGIGTTLIPIDKEDPDKAGVGAVTSGTGEHMATTMASQKCAERLYHGTRRGEGGVDIEEQEESAIMESFIVNDFQNHPGVLNSSSASAIGAMAVKQTRTGYYLYFAHNTDSFALASMCSRDRNPHCVMSRLKEESTGVAQGARKIHAR